MVHSYDQDMKADVWVREEELPNPALEKSTDVIVKIGGSGVCRTDLHIVEGIWRPIFDLEGNYLPIVMGHENTGWFEEACPEVEGPKKGDPVIIHPKITGGHAWIAEGATTCMPRALSRDWIPKADTPNCYEPASGIS